jgi:hypothetical protein
MALLPTCITFVYVKHILDINYKRLQTDLAIFVYSRVWKLDRNSGSQIVAVMGVSI